MFDPKKTTQRSESPDRWIKLPEIQKLTTYSRSSIYRLMAENSFPAGTKLSPRCTVWRLSTIQNWMALKEQEAANQTNFSEES